MTIGSARHRGTLRLCPGHPWWEGRPRSIVHTPSPPIALVKKNFLGISIEIAYHRQEATPPGGRDRRRLGLHHHPGLEARRLGFLESSASGEGGGRRGTRTVPDDRTHPGVLFSVPFREREGDQRPAAFFWGRLRFDSTRDWKNEPNRPLN